jgi:hypothetical protein
MGEWRYSTQFNLGSGGRRVVIFTLLSLSSLGKWLGYPSDRRPSGHLRRFGRDGDEMSLPGIGHHRPDDGGNKDL